MGEENTNIMCVCVCVVCMCVWGNNCDGVDFTGREDSRLSVEGWDYFIGWGWCNFSSKCYHVSFRASLLAQMVKNPPATGRPGSDPWVGKIPGGGHGNLLQYSCLENPMDRGSLVGYNPWGHKESNLTEWLNTYMYHLSLLLTASSSSSKNIRYQWC